MKPSPSKSQKIFFLMDSTSRSDAEKHRRNASIIVGGIACILAIYHLKLLPLLLMVSLGCVIGYTLASPDVSRAAGQRYSTDNLNRFTQMMREVSTESLEENARRMDKLTSSLRRHVRHAGLQECFNQLADCIVKDFVDFWYISMLNASPVAGLMNQRQQEHQSWATVESTARSDFKRLIHYVLGVLCHHSSKVLRRRDIDVEISNLITFGIANVFIVHMRECRKVTTMSADGKSSRPSSASFQHSGKEFLQRITLITERLVKRVFPIKDSQSSALCAFVSEIVAHYVMVPIILKLSAPSFINASIVSIFAASAAQQASGPSPGSFRRTVSLSKSPVGDDADFPVINSADGNLEEVADPESLTLADILERNDLFALMMEFMESIQAPPYLRFWTNADIYRQFAQLATQELASLKKDSVAKVQTLEALRADALAVFNAHLSAIADLPILLCTPMLLASTVDYDDILSETFEEEALLQHRELVRAIRNEIERSPTAECFIPAQKSVLKILECEFEQLFKRSSLFRQYFGLELVAEDDRERLGNADSVESVLTDAESVDFSTMHRITNNQAFNDNASVSSPNSVKAMADADNHLSDAISDGDMDIATQPLTPPVISNASSLQLQNDAGSTQNGKEHRTQKLADDAIVHVAAALTSLREQKMLVSSSINRLRAASKVTLGLEGSAKLRSMRKNLRDLDRQIQQMSLMAKDMDTFKPNADKIQSFDNPEDYAKRTAPFAEVDAIGDSAKPMVNNLIDLRGISVKLVDMGSNEETAELSSNISVPVSAVASAEVLLPTAANPASLISTLGRKITSTISGSFSLTNYIRSMLISIEIERSNSALSPLSNTQTAANSPISGSIGWIVSRRLSDFQALYATLGTQFPKVSKIPFPVVPPRSGSILSSLGGGGGTASAAATAAQDFEERKGKFLKDLTNFLQILLADQLLCETKAMQLFLRPDNYAALLQSRKAAAEQQQQQQLASNKAPMDLQSLQTLLRQRMAKLLKQTRLPVVLTPPQYAGSKSVDSVTSSSSSLLPNDDASVANDDRMEKSMRTATVDLDLYIDTFFGLLTEMFDLQQRNQWLRRKALSAMRQYLLQQSRRGQGRIYTQMVARVTGFFEAIFGRPSVPASPSSTGGNGNDSGNSAVDESKSDEALYGMIGWLLDSFWPPPDRQWQSVPPPTAEQQEKQRVLHDNLEKEARALFLGVFGDQAQSGAVEDSLVGEVGMMLNRMVGRYNTAVGCQRLFEMVQQEESNRQLVLSIFECVSNIALSEDRRII